MTGLGLRLSKIRKSLGLSQAAFAKEIDEARGAPAISQWENEVYTPSITVIDKICERFNINANWLISGQGEMFWSDVIKLFSDVGSSLDEFDFVPEFHQDIAAGHGAFVLSQEVKNQYAFRKEWISKYCSKNRCALFTAKGDSMLPLIGNGDKILVDMSKKEMSDIIDGKIYVFSEGDLLKVKRLVRKGSGLLAISDNKAEIPDPVEVDMLQFRLVGKVIWVGHVVK